MYNNFPKTDREIPTFLLFRKMRERTYFLPVLCVEVL